MLLVLYIDNTKVTCPNRGDIEKFVSKLKNLGFDLDIKYDWNIYLGIKIEQTTNGALSMTQKGLISKVMNRAKIENCNPMKMTKQQVGFGSDPKEELFSMKKWNYPSIIWILLYLSDNTRQYITFSVIQVTRFINKPKKSHSKAVEMILHYLKRTSNKSLIVKPDRTYNLNIWVDTDFSWLYGRDPGDNPNSARFYYGYITIYGGVPVYWKSKLIHNLIEYYTHWIYMLYWLYGT